MLFVKKHQLITIAGLLWFAVGLMLLLKGLYLLLFIAQFHGKHAGPLLNAIMYAFTGAVIPSIILIIAVGLIIGIFKARFALSRSVKRTIDRIYPHQGPIKITQLYRIHDYLLIAAMIGVGRLMHFLAFPSDLHGLVDVAIGSALINGAMIYFRYAIKIREQHT